MTGKFIKTGLLAIVVSLSCSQAVRADGTTTTTTPSTPAHKHHHPIQFILDHATELGLTDAQKTQLEALKAKIKQHEAQHHNAGTGQTQNATAGQSGQHHKWLHEQIEKILTAAQMEKLKALREAHHGAGKNGK
jgi:hypothetical protein